MIIYVTWQPKAGLLYNKIKKDGSNIMWDKIRNLDIEKVKLDWISGINILVGKEIFPSQQQSFVHVNGLLTKCFVVIQPIHCNIK